MQINFIAVAPCGIWAERITRDRRPAKINIIDLQRLE